MQSTMRAILALLVLPFILLPAKADVKNHSFKSQAEDKALLHNAGSASGALESTVSETLSSNNTYDLAKRQSTWQYYNDVSQLCPRCLLQEARSC